MKTIINTACAEYFIDGNKKIIVSKDLKLYAIVKDNFIQGEILCSRSCHCWQMKIVCKDTGSVVFSLGGSKSKTFCFELNPIFQYKLYFYADKNSTLRLYRTPCCLTDINHSDKI